MPNAEDAVLHERLTRTLPVYEPNTPLSHWVGHQDDPRHELLPGTVLRAKDGDPSDDWYLVRVTGPVETGRDRLEYGVTPLLTFGEIVSAPARGDGSILASYDVLGTSEVAALLDERASEQTETEVEAARAQLDAARAE